MTSKARANADKDLVDREDLTDLECSCTGEGGTGEPSGNAVTKNELEEALENQELDAGTF